MWAVRLLFGVAFLGVTAGASTPRQLTAASIRTAAALQDALDHATPGDVIELEPGQVYAGTFTLPSRHADPDDDTDDVITLRTRGAWPSADVRVTPSSASRFAVLRSVSDDPALRTSPGTHHWRIENLALEGGGEGRGTVVALGDGDESQRRLVDVPHHLELVRLYIHGDDVRPQRRGLALNSASTQVVGSWIDGMRFVGEDSQAIAGWNGPGPFRIANCHLEAAGEVVLFGGGDPAIPDLVPSEIDITDSHLTRPTSWRRSGERWTIKNLLELKNARDVRIEGNLLEHHWPDAQAGYAVVLTPRNQDGGAPWSTVERVRFVGNVVRRVSGGVSMLGQDDERPSLRARDITIADNLFVDVGGTWGEPGDFLQMGDGPADVRVERNLVLQTGRAVSVYGDGPRTEAPGFVFRDNVVRHNRYGILGDAVGTGLVALRRFLPDATVTGNVFAGGAPRDYPPGNQFLAASALDDLLTEGPDGYGWRSGRAVGGIDLQRFSPVVVQAGRRDSPAVGARLAP